MKWITLSEKKFLTFPNERQNDNSLEHFRKFDFSIEVQASFFVFSKFYVENYFYLKKKIK